MNWREIWIDAKSGRVRSGWRVLAFLAMASALYLLLTMLFLPFLPKGTRLDIYPGIYLGVLVDVLAAIPAAIAAGIWALRVFDRLPPRTLGITPAGPWAPFMGAGLLFGLLMAAAGVAVLWAGGAATVAWQGGGTRTLIFVAAAVVFTLLLAAREELVFRGYPFQTLLRGIGPAGTLLLTSLAFALVHLLNPVSSLLGLTNIFLAGVIFGLLYLRTGSLWLPIGLHAGWNLGLVLFRVPVSGFEVNVPTPLATTFNGPALLTGGPVGLEGSVVVSGLWLGVIAALTYGRFGLPLELRWWEWRDLETTTEAPRNWDFTIGERHYQWKLLSRDQPE